MTATKSRSHLDKMNDAGSGVCSGPDGGCGASAMSSGCFAKLHSREKQLWSECTAAAHAEEEGCSFAQNPADQRVSTKESAEHIAFCVCMTSASAEVVFMSLLFDTQSRKTESKQAKRRSRVTKFSRKFPEIQNQNLTNVNRPTFRQSTLRVLLMGGHNLDLTGVREPWRVIICAPQLWVTVVMLSTGAPSLTSTDPARRTVFVDTIPLSLTCRLGWSDVRQFPLGVPAVRLRLSAARGSSGSDSDPRGEVDKSTQKARRVSVFCHGTGRIPGVKTCWFSSTKPLDSSLNQQEAGITAPSAVCQQRRTHALSFL